jgi:benzylsuccinate CoA-transferase BbsE subunit
MDPGTKNNRDTLLSGMRILDLADQKASFSGKLLADLGARVIKVERPGGGPDRNPQDGGQANLTFSYHNTNKQAVTLNLEHPRGRELFLRLVKRSDAVLETFAPGCLKKLGLGFDRLREANPGIILASVTGYGQSGPQKDDRSCNLTAAAAGGQMYVTGCPDSFPLALAGQQSYLAASLFAAIAVLMAFRRRRHTGTGEHIDISLQEAVLSSTEHLVLQYFYQHVIPGRQGPLHWNHLFHILPCRDGFIQMTLTEQWETLVEWMDAEGRAEDLTAEKWRNGEYRLKHLEHVIEVLQRWTKTHTTDELFKLGQLMQFPWAPVQSPTQILNCPQLKARDYFQDIAHPEAARPLRYPKLPFKFSEPLGTPCRRAPAAGEDNRRIYHEELGISEGDLKILAAQGII